MVSLDDVLGTPRTVEVRGKSLQVSGVPLELFPVLYRRFPDECAQLGEMTKIDPQLLLTVLPALVAPVIAAGLGFPGNLEAEATVRRFNFMEQIKLLKAIFEETAPDGLDPLLEEVRALMDQLGSGPVSAAVNGAASKPSSKPSRKSLSS